MSPRQGTAAALVSAIALAGCGGDDSSEAPATPRTAKVDIAGFKYKPETVRVAVGGTVTFVNRDRAAHTATAEGAFDTGRLKRGESGEVRVAKAGRVEYLCSFHPYMKAVVEAE